MKCYDSGKENKYITYLDANNLYGRTMSQYLSYSLFKWLSKKEINGFCLNSIEENSSIGCILEIHLEYHDTLHKLHNYYPLAQENLEIRQDMLSKYCNNIANEYGIKIGDVNKLVPSLGNKSKYVLHYRNLQLYFSLGMKLTKIHKILKFRLSDWLKRYIDFNTKKKNAANSFEEDFFKLMNNSFFGKAMENLRKRINTRWVNNAKNYIRYISKPIFVSQKIFSKNCVAIHEIKPFLTLNKPIYVGFSILDLRKFLIYEFHYKYIKSKYSANLLFTVRDSLVYEIETEDVYEDFYKNKNLFDFNDYPLHSKLFDPPNKKVIAKMKDEFRIISEFVRLNSEMYSLIVVDGEEVKKTK